MPCEGLKAMPDHLFIIQQELLVKLYDQLLLFIFLNGDLKTS